MSEETSTERFRPQIEALLADVGLHRCKLVIVPSQDLVNARWGLDDNPFRVARAVALDNTPVIVLSAIITRDVRRGIIGGMEFAGFGPEDLNRIEDPLMFLEHLVLHEAAHHLGVRGEVACDRWAFDHLVGRFR